MTPTQLILKEALTFLKTFGMDRDEQIRLLNMISEAYEEEKTVKTYTKEILPNKDIKYTITKGELKFVIILYYGEYSGTYTHFEIIINSNYPEVLGELEEFKYLSLNIDRDLKELGYTKIN